MRHVLIVSWASGGNLPPLLAAGKLLTARDHRVCVLASSATRQLAVDAGFDVVGYRRGPIRMMDTAFEQHAAQMMAIAAGTEIAVDVCEVVAELRPDLMIVDCMLPAGIAAGESTGIPTVSLVHFPYGLARTQMQRGAGAWTTDRAQLNITRSSLGLEPARDDLAAWESVGLLLVTVPRWFDLATDYPANVVHAGPLGVTRAPQDGSTSDGRPLVLLSFSTTVMQGQVALIQRVCDAIAPQAVDAILTLGPAVSAEAIRAPRNIEIFRTPTTTSCSHAAPRSSPTAGWARRSDRLPTVRRFSCSRLGATSSSTQGGSSSSVPASACLSKLRRARSRQPSWNSSLNRGSGTPPPMLPRRSRLTGPTRPRPRRCSLSPRSPADT